jgi:hypothetical protein
MWQARHVTTLLLLPLSVSVILVATYAQTPQPATPSQARLALKAVVVLDPAFCSSKTSQGSFWKLGKTTFFAGKVFCAEVEQALKEKFSSVTHSADETSASTMDAQVVFVPRVVNVSMKWA